MSRWAAFDICSYLLINYGFQLFISFIFIGLRTETDISWLITYTVECRYNAIQYNMVLQTAFGMATSENESLTLVTRRPSRGPVDHPAKWSNQRLWCIVGAHNQLVQEDSRPDIWCSYPATWGDWWELRAWHMQIIKLKLKTAVAQLF